MDILWKRFYPEYIDGRNIFDGTAYDNYIEKDFEGKEYFFRPPESNCRRLRAVTGTENWKVHPGVDQVSNIIRPGFRYAK